MKADLLVTAHAACMGHAPENTLAGMRKAIELAADAVEVDVRCTADGVPVLLHDETVDRTTNGKRRHQPDDVRRGAPPGRRRRALPRRADPVAARGAWR